METLDFEAFDMIALEKGCDVAFPLKEKLLIEVVKQIMACRPRRDGAA